MSRFFALFDIAVSILASQTGTSRIRGVTTDSSGAIVPEAEVSVLHDATGLKRSALTNASGQYSFEAMPLGTYTVTVTKQGFKKVSSRNNELQVGEPLTVDLILEVG